MENLALEYVNTFLNGSDIEAKKKFVSDKIHPDVKAIFQMAQSTETPEDNKLKNATVIESEDYTDSTGGKDKLILIQGEKPSNPKSELVILIKDDKIGWGYSSSDKEKAAFNEIRKLFKEPVPDTSDSGNVSSATGEQSPKSMLTDIRNFVVSDIWNVGFVDISSYISSGTSSTGENMDIDFTIEQLGKAMNKKAEYDAYIRGLDTKYDSIKKIWIKLSGEIDRMYKQIQDTPPKANDTNSKLDTGIFKQYLSAFTDEVDDLTK
ncbi:hypothetical protein NYE24_12135 [Paenibacillus sp. FSL H7-0350]|uniref:hypothetical protein n=1 Tax=unclassified Paenibacillus TaxID=185978 RepID=UPI0003E21F40|nr:hypothetical protein [Paenibacillus sp. FSL R7-269]ETT56330.1 hypothetical protein C162_01484 [Paenibacillus sp. FSL R7-269]